MAKSNGKNNFWFKFFVNDFITDTARLDAAQTGAYVTLLCEQWNYGFIPDDEAQLARIGRCSPPQWEREVRPAVMSFFKRVEGGWANARMAELRSERQATSKIRKDASFIANEAKRLKNTRTEHVDQPESESEPEPEPESPAAAPKTRGRKLKPTTECGAFDDFYQKYPRHEARADAQKAWGQVVDKGHAPEAIIAGLKNFRFSDERKFVPLPASWLRGERWTDEAPAPGGGLARPPAPVAREFVHAGRALTEAEIRELAAG